MLNAKVNEGVTAFFAQVFEIRHEVPENFAEVRIIKCEILKK